jgi:hypothetical protein
VKAQASGTKAEFFPKLLRAGAESESQLTTAPDGLTKKSEQAVRSELDQNAHTFRLSKNEYRIEELKVA